MTAEATLRMDRMYRYQRHIYDLSRKFYLLGRDRLVRELDPGPGARICEIGCGTGRNLVALARRYPDARIFGIDASNEMLKTAHATIARAGLAGRIRIERCLADELDPAGTFGLDAPFDAVLFSYTLSMIADWRRAVDRATEVLKPAGLLAVVDFSEQR
ncbi:MAG TPA: class I SAM-dependent methyltransferase, partial [Stellaceae bacterium]|nr:class I SAM-dependent methyltransferase [Stellaceae bacterium]